MTELPPGEHVSLRIVARWLGRDYRTLLRMIAREELRGRRVGVRWYILRADALALRHMTPSGTQEARATLDRIDPPKR